MKKNRHWRSFKVRLKKLFRNKKLIKTAKTPGFAKWYAFFAISVLLITSLFWAILSAHLHSQNADQLVDSYLLANSHTFHEALWPGAHTFLVKWPLFFLVKLLGLTGFAFIFLTIILVLITVGALAAILYWVDRRPLVFGTTCLALSSVLLLVPPAPYAGAILPLNTAMLTTRNIEYILYLVSLVLLLRAPSPKQWRFWPPVALLAILFASDRLFFSLSLVGALMALTVYALAKGWNLVTVSVNWLVASVAAAISSIGLLSILNLARITHIVNTPGASPYGLVLNVHDLVLGVFYSLMGLLTNLGANPAFDANVVRDAPHLAWARLSGVGGISFLINLVVLLFGIFAASQIIRRSLAHNRKKTVKLDPASRLSLTLIWTSLAAILIFILTNHYYAVDARYLGIVLFTLFVSLATYSRKRKWNVGTLAIINIVLLVSIGLGSAQALNTYHYDKKALDPISARNSLVIGALMHHHVNSLVGDYWRVIPTSQLMGKQSINFIPLADCFQPRDMLDSKAWNRDLSKASFAYLLSLDRSLTNYPQCSLDQVTGKYGRPNSSVLIAGTLDSPKELLLFYDHGTHLSSPQSTNKPLSTVLPIDLADLPYKSCSVPTIMNIVAHEDDDLLFLSPDLIHDIQAEHCIRTIYLTAGDGGNDQFYWLSRQRGSQAAYAEMIGLKNTTWVDRIVKLDNHQFITISNPKGNSKISLIFMHLPDGNLKGQGFSAQNYESLAKLDAHQISTIKSVDSQSFYSSEELISALKSFMHLYQPSEIRTQANSQGAVFTDHSDHRAVGRYVNQAYQQYETEQYENKTSIPISFYLSYPGRERPENIFDGDLVSKMEAFATYGKFDGAVCSSVELCTTNQIYNAYLRREYIESH